MDEEKNQGASVEVLSEQLEKWSCYIEGSTEEKQVGREGQEFNQLKKFLLDSWIL